MGIPMSVAPVNKNEDGRYFVTDPEFADGWAVFETPETGAIVVKSIHDTKQEATTALAEAYERTLRKLGYILSQRPARERTPYPHEDHVARPGIGRNPHS